MEGVEDEEIARFLNDHHRDQGGPMTGRRRHLQKAVQGITGSGGR
jgi:hypothetical protein